MVDTGKQSGDVAAVRRRAGRSGGSILLMLALIVGLALAFAFFVTRQSASIARGNDSSAFQRLAIAAQGFENWPSIAQQMAARSLQWRKTEADTPVATALPFESPLQHPQFGRLDLDYVECERDTAAAEAVDVQLHAEKKLMSLTTSMRSASKPDASRPKPAKVADVPTTVDIGEAGLIVKGPTVTNDHPHNSAVLSDDATRARAETRLPKDKNGEICFTLGPIAFDKALQLPAGFLSLLIIKQEDKPAPGDKATPAKPGAPAAAGAESAIVRPGKVIAQVGPEKLPIRSLEELPDLDAALQRKAQAIAELAAQQTTGSAAAVASARTLLDSGHADTLAPLETVIAGKAYRLYPYPVSLVVKAGDPPTKLLLVGAMPATSAFLSPELSGARLLAFGLLLAALLALTPFMRLAFLGPVDAVKPMELVTLALGLVLIGAISAALLALGWDSVNSQAADDAALRAQAETLATGIGDEIAGVSQTPLKDKSWIKKVPATDQGSNHRIVEKLDIARPDLPGAVDLPVPDALFFLDKDGRQPHFPAFGAVERQRISGLYALGDRPYFLRAVAGDVVPGTATAARDFANRLGFCDIDPGGFVVDHLLSRADGVAKAIIAFPLARRTSRVSCPTDQIAAIDKGDIADRLAANQAKVVGAAMVMQTMLAPRLTPGIGYAVVDLARPGWPSVFHSDAQRAHAEFFELSLGADAHDAFRRRAELRPHPICEKGSTADAMAFGGGYIGKTHRLATVRVPCTDWAVVTFRAFSVTDRAASQPAEIAIFAWAGIAVIVGGFVLIVLWLLNRNGYPVMQSFWPDPGLMPLYRTTCLIGIGAGLACLLLGIAVPALADGLAVIAAFIGLVLIVNIYWCGRRMVGDRRALDLRTERWFGGHVAALVMLLSIVPVLLLAHDSRSFFGAVAEQQAQIAYEAAAQAEVKQKVLIWNSMFPSDPRRLDTGDHALPCSVDGLFTPVLLKLAERDVGQMASNATPAFDTPTCQPAAGESASLDARQQFGLFLMAIAALVLPGLALFSMCRNLFGFGVPLEAVDYPRLSEPDFAFVAADQVPGDLYWDRFYPGSAVVRLTGDLGLSTDTNVGRERPVLRLHVLEAALSGKDSNLLVARLQALYPLVVPPKDGSPAGGRPRLLLVVPTRLANNWALQPAMRLVDWTAENASPYDETLALRRGERLADWKAENRPPYDEANAPWLAMLVSADDTLRHRLTEYASHSFDLFEVRDFNTIRRKLSGASSAASPVPLIIAHNLELLLRNDAERVAALRLLELLVLHQRQERKAGKGYRILLLADISPLDRFLQASEFREEQEEAGAPDPMADPAESIRWSRLLENFTTYTRRIRARVSASELQALQEKRRLDGQLGFLLRELNHIPDRVVEALLPDFDGVVTTDDILRWGQFLKNSRPAAISDFLASQLIEHYHYLWSISSRAEQILIHRFAAGALPNIRTAYALRSLVRRGIVVFDPAPRLMSQSFAGFVRHVERPELLNIWQNNAPKGLWSRLHGNITVVLPLLLLLGVTIVLRGSVGLEAAIPLFLAAGPALLNALFGGRRTA